VSLLICSHPAFAQLEGTYEVVIKKQEEKQSARWSLNDWLAQKQKNQMADMWLAKNSHSSLYEFFLDLESYNYGESTSSNSSVNNQYLYSGMIAAYAGVVGLRGGYQSDTETRSDWSGSFNIRLFGRAVQDTHINLEYGLTGLTINSTGSAAETFQNQYGGVSTDIYLTKKFGLEGVYQRLLPAQSNLNRTMQGERETAGIFIDFSILRIFGNWRNEVLIFNGPSSSEYRQGFGGGIRLYF
jgi:hypothetical protein